MADQIGYVKTTALSGVLMAATNVLFFLKWYDGISGCTDLFGVCLRF